MPLDDLTHSTGEWLKGHGPQSEIVVSSRARLARNLKTHHFIGCMDEAQRTEVVQAVRSALASVPGGLAMEWYDLESLDETDRAFLWERHLISREILEAEGARSLALNDDETLALMVNEEDHLRLQAIRSGLQLEEAFHAVDGFDDALSAVLDFAYDKTLGYLTACPTNVGTGMRVSVMLHLPALAMSRRVEKAFRAVHDLRLTVRGLYGEGTEAHGDFYQISNQVTLGKGEAAILEALRVAVDGIIDYERKLRQRLLADDTHRLEDRVWRAYATLRHARMLESEEAMRLLSMVRLGVYLAILPRIDLPSLNEMFIYTQPAHLQRQEGCELPPEARDVARARYIRDHLARAEAAAAGDGNGEGDGDRAARPNEGPDSEGRGGNGPAAGGPATGQSTPGDTEDDGP